MEGPTSQTTARRWRRRTLILDDVVNSFDAAHRHGLMRLLEEEFAEWQVIVFSHDAGFRDIAIADDLKELHDVFRCDACNKPVCHAELSGGSHQCECGMLRA